jgi:uncharacterized membrane protein
MALLPANVAFGFDGFLFLLIALLTPPVVGALVFGGIAAAVVGPRRWRSIRLPALAAFAATFLSVFFGPAVPGRGPLEIAILQLGTAFVAAGAQRVLYGMVAEGGSAARSASWIRGAIIGALVGAIPGILVAVANSRNMVLLLALTAFGAAVGIFWTRGQSPDLESPPLPIPPGSIPPPVLPPPGLG